MTKHKSEGKKAVAWAVFYFIKQPNFCPPAQCIFLQSNPIKRSPLWWEPAQSGNTVPYSKMIGLQIQPMKLKQRRGQDMCGGKTAFFLQFALTIVYMWKSFQHLNALGMSLMWVYTPAGLPNADTIIVIRYPPSAACQSNSWDEKNPRSSMQSNELVLKQSCSKCLFLSTLY